MSGLKGGAEGSVSGDFDDAKSAIGDDDTKGGDISGGYSDECQ